jgi:hypothetical protein
MKALLLAAAFLLLAPTSAPAFEILAIGTSNTNCKGVDRAMSFTVQLEGLLRAEGFDATVVNSGVDGDRPVWMAARLFGTNGINANTKLVIFEPGPNDRNVSANVAFSEKILAQLQERRMPTIYISSRLIQNEQEAQATAQKYGAHYYGQWGKEVPRDRTYWQYDMAGPGHMSGEGCQLWARRMLPFVKNVLAEIGIAAAAKR